MTRKMLNPDTVSRPVAPYSGAVLTDARETLYIAGQFPVDKDGNLVGPGDIERQARACFDNIGRMLAAAGMTWTHVVKFNVFMTRREDRDAFTAMREELFPRLFPGGDYPISTLIFINGLYHEEYLIEIDATAVR